jgi:hypothetical protein
MNHQRDFLSHQFAFGFARHPIPSIPSFRVSIDYLARGLDCTPVCTIRLIPCHEMALDPRYA